MSRSGSPKGVIQDKWIPTQSRCKGHLPAINLSLHDMLEGMNKEPVIKEPKYGICKDCKTAPRHRTPSKQLSCCLACYNIRKQKYRKRSNGYQPKGARNE